MAPPLSIVIPSFNRRQELLRLLDSLAGQSLPPSEFEVVVVLDGSSDGSEAAANAREWPFTIRVIEQLNAGAGVARNTGAALAEGSFLLFVDDDIVLEPDALQYHLSTAATVEHAAVLGHLSTIWRTRGIGATNSRIWATLEKLEDLAQLRFSLCYSGNLLVPAAEFLAVGGFNPQLRRMEDCELGYRLDQAGVPLIYCRGAAGVQFNSKSTVEVLDDAATTGASAMTLFRTEPDFLAALPRAGRLTRGAAARFLAELASRMPVPKVAATCAGALPPEIPGVTRLHDALWLRWYLVGARRASTGRAEFRAFLSRK